jgi:hypothetical protein
LFHSLGIQFGASTTHFFQFQGFGEVDTGITTGLVVFVSQGDVIVQKWEETIVGFLLSIQVARPIINGADQRLDIISW